jgi:hypothetical protein
LNWRLREGLLQLILGFRHFLKVRPMHAFLNFVKEDWYFAIPMFIMSLVAIT